MFTGIIAAVGQIETVQALVEAPTEALSAASSIGTAGVRLSIHAGALDLDDVQLGDSIAVNGACMTVVEKNTSHFSVDVSQESLRCTVGLDQPGPVNLEKAMRLSDRIGGHLVTGHVDGVGRVLQLTPVAESWLLEILAPTEMAKYLACKGSVVVNGVSLTVNTVRDLTEGCAIAINLIPHTINHTTLKHLQTGAPVNLEIDLIARYIERMQQLNSAA